MKLLGLTGGIACGKSTISAFLGEMGCPVIDADICAREVVEPGTVGLAAVAAAFGPGILREDGALDRKRLGGIVFSDEEKLEVLNGIMQPLIRRDIEDGIAGLQDSPLVVLDAPLLIEQHYEKMCDFVMVVETSEKIQLSRLVERDGLSPTEARRRIASQLTQEERRRHADVVIDSSGTVEQTRRQVIKWLETVCLWKIIRNQ